MLGLGLCLGLPQPLTMAWVAAIVSPTLQGVALGLRLTVNRAAQVSLPLVAASLVGSVGVMGIFWFNAALLIGAVIVAGGSDRGDPVIDEE